MKKNKKKLSKKKAIRKKPIRRKSIRKKSIRKKSIRKKSIRRKSIRKKPIKKLINQKGFKVKRKLKFIKKKIKNIKRKQRKIPRTSKNAILKIIRFQDKLKPKFNFNFFESTKKFIKGFFQKITDTIEDYNIIKEGERKRKKLEEIQSIEKERIERDKQAKVDEDLKIKLKEQAIKEDIKLEKEIVKDIKLFLRKEQAIVRREQADKQRKFLIQLKLDKQIEKFRIREVKELEKLEKISLKEKREDYSGLQERIEKLKAKYRVIRDQKIRERVEALGVKIQEDDDRETLLQKEKDYTIARQKIELSLESFYRSANSLVFQLNKRHITKHMSIFRCIDRRFETGEIFIKWDESNDDEWLILIYIKNNLPDEGIVIEDKSNPEKNLSHEFKSNEIFKASDMMVDSLTRLIARIREKKD
jgi:hypothetical protein